MNKNLKAEIIRIFGTQYQFAGVLRIRESMVSAVIQGRQELDDASKMRWANALGQDVEKLFSKEVNGNV